MQLEIQDIHKHYGAQKANNGISMTIEPGTIHGVLGENGAGKSTLMKMLAGYIEKTSGAIYINGKVADYKTPTDAARLGIGMLYQEPLDYLPLTQLENFMIGQTSGLVDQSRFYLKKFQQLNHHFNFALNPEETVSRLTVGERQQLEIMRLVSCGVEVLILDEPTTGITSEQKTSLFQALKQLAAEGKSVILVSHKLQDAETLCDHVTVLRNGKVTGSTRQPYDADILLSMMFDTPPVPPTRSALECGKPVLKMRQVFAGGGRSGLSDCSILVRQYEMVGLAGLEGSGQGGFLRLAAGISTPSAGSIELFGEPFGPKNHSKVKTDGVVFLPTSRLEEGLMPGLSIMEHFALRDRGRGLFVKWSHADRTAREKIEKFRIAGQLDTTVENLSGGNQQRLLLSLMSKQSFLLLLEQPTRGLDVESAHWVWRHLHQYCQRGASVIFSSSDVDEIMMVADRILVFFDGRIIRDIRRDNVEISELSRLIAGKI